MSKVEGFIKSINGQIAQVQITSQTPPTLLEVLVCIDDPEVKLEVYFHSGDTAFCLILSNPLKLHRGLRLLGSGTDLKIAVGKDLLGKVINLYGQSLDPKQKFKPDSSLSIYSKTPPINILKGSFEVLETGIKAIDFLTPILKGGKV